jgi:hypothetical protein
VLDLQSYKSFKLANSEFIGATIVFTLYSLGILLPWIIWVPIFPFLAMDQEPGASTVIYVVVNLVLILGLIIPHVAVFRYFIGRKRKLAANPFGAAVRWADSTKTPVRNMWAHYQSRIGEIVALERNAIDIQESVAAGKGILVISGANFRLYSNWLDSVGPTGSIRGASATFTDTTTVSQSSIITGATTLFTQPDSSGIGAAGTKFHTQTRTHVGGSVVSEVSGPELVKGHLLFASAEDGVTFVNVLNHQVAKFEESLASFDDYLEHAEQQLRQAAADKRDLDDWLIQSTQVYRENLTHELAAHLWGGVVAGRIYAYN